MYKVRFQAGCTISVGTKNGVKFVDSERLDRSFDALKDYVIMRQSEAYGSVGPETEIIVLCFHKLA